MSQWASFWLAGWTTDTIFAITTYTPNNLEMRACLTVMVLLDINSLLRQKGVWVKRQRSTYVLKTSHYVVFIQSCYSLNIIPSYFLVPKSNKTTLLVVSSIPERKIGMANISKSTKAKPSSIYQHYCCVCSNYRKRWVEHELF